MKKVFLLLFAISLCGSVTGCGDKGGANKCSCNESSGSEESDIKAGIIAAQKKAEALAHAGSSMMMDMDTKDNEDIDGIYWMTGETIGAKGETVSNDSRIKNEERILRYIGNYFSDITDCEEAGIYFVHGTGAGAYVKFDGSFGTYPKGLIRAEDYEYEDLTPKDCRKLIEKELDAEFNW